MAQDQVPNCMLKPAYVSQMRNGDEVGVAVRYFIGDICNRVWLFLSAPVAEPQQGMVTVKKQDGGLVFDFALAGRVELPRGDPRVGTMGVGRQVVGVTC